MLSLADDPSDSAEGSEDKIDLGDMDVEMFIPVLNQGRFGFCWMIGKQDRITNEIPHVA